MRKYETIFISDPDIQDKVRDELFEKVKNIITSLDGYIVDFDDWGIKKLAYDIRKKSRGHYVCVCYGGTGEVVKELERNFGLHDYVMRFMTILLCDHITMEQLEKEAEEAKSKPKKSDLANDNKEEYGDSEDNYVNDETGDAKSFKDSPSDNVEDSAEENISENKDAGKDSEAADDSEKSSEDLSAKQTESEEALPKQSDATE